MDRVEIIWHSFHSVGDESEAAEDDAESDSREESESRSEDSQDNDSFLPVERKDIVWKLKLSLYEPNRQKP